MKTELAVKLSKLRHEKGLSQRQAAAELGISQALLSHYENNAREPKLDFVIKACEYYRVTADYILGRTNERRTGASRLSGQINEILDMLDKVKEEEAELIAKLRMLTGDYLR